MQWLVDLILEAIGDVGGVPSGVVCAWSGAIVDIPDGWYLCDGNNGTPDLRNRFIVGAGDTYGVGATGGNTSHPHAVTCAPHTHTLDSGVGLGGSGKNDPTMNAVQVTGNATYANHLPPYYALAFIMKS